MLYLRSQTDRCNMTARPAHDRSSPFKRCCKRIWRTPDNSTRHWAVAWVDNRGRGRRYIEENYADCTKCKYKLICLMCGETDYTFEGT